MALAIWYPNGQVEACLMYILVGGVPTPWDGTFSGSITIGAITGTKGNNTATPGTDNLGAMTAVATAAAPTYTEGRLVALSTDLGGSLRVSATIDTSLIATAANQTNGNQKVKGTGTAGAADANVLTVQGIASMTPVQVSQATAANLNATVVIAAGSAVIGHVITDSGSVTAAVLTTGSAQIGHLEANQSSNVAQINGVTPLMGAGNTGTGSLRVTVASDQAAIATAETVPTTVINGKKTVTTAGTRVTLAASTASKSVTVKALAANTGTIYVGDTSVASTNGFALAAGDSVSFDISNLNTINLDSSVNGEGVTFLAVV